MSPPNNDTDSDDIEQEAVEEADELVELLTEETNNNDNDNDDTAPESDEPGSTESLDRVPLDTIKEQSDAVLASFFDPANGMHTWFPILSELDIPVPETRLFDLEDNLDIHVVAPQEDYIPLLMTDEPDPKLDVYGVPEVTYDELADYVNIELDGKAFIRSYYKSPSHGDNVNPIVEPEPEAFRFILADIIDDHIMQGIPTGGGFAIREFLDLDFAPDSKHTQHPEARFFIDDGEVLYHWPRMNTAHFDDESVYDEQVQYIEDNVDELREYASRAADAFAPHSWSIDFVMTTDEEWYCTDMAVNALYWNEEKQRWHNHSEHAADSEHNLAKTVGSELPAPESPPDGFPAWRDIDKEHYN